MGSTKVSVMVYPVVNPRVDCTLLPCQAEGTAADDEVQCPAASMWSGPSRSDESAFHPLGVTVPPWPPYQHIDNLLPSSYLTAHLRPTLSPDPR